MPKKRNVLIPTLADSDAEKEWVGMPEFVQKEKEPYQKIILRFNNRKDVKRFAKLVGQKITPRTKSMWYPKIIIDRYMDKRYVDES